MKKLPATSQEFPLLSAEDSEIQKSEPTSPTPFMTFRYTSHQMHISNGQTQVHSKHVSFDGSKINVEEFEGQLPASVFEQSLLDTQRHFLNQTANMLKQFSAWLPFPMIDRDDKK